MGQKVLVVGQGGREHALIWKLKQDPQIGKLYAAPGNPGIALLAECVDIKPEEVEELLAWAQAEKIDFTVVGPEIPLMQGIVDKFTAAGLKIFGPTAAAARLEGSKIFAKNLFKKYHIPTADFESFVAAGPALFYAEALLQKGKPIVIKADGLAAGKGVVIAQDMEEARRTIYSMMEAKSFGSAGEKVIIEEYLTGEEVSFFAVSDGENILPLISAQDHKRVFDNDQGPNTGGMGAYVNPPIFSPALQAEVERTIIQPVIAAMAQEGCPYKGVLYAGLMLTADGPKVLEFNARFGDPETQAIMPMIKGDILPLFEAAVDCRLKDHKIEIEAGACICVVLAAQGYPGPYEKGRLIEGLEKLQPDTRVFHAGTCLKDGAYYTGGGRVMAIVCRGSDIKGAQAKVYGEIQKINFSGMHYRRDIGGKALAEERI